MIICTIHIVNGSETFSSFIKIVLLIHFVNLLVCLSLNNISANLETDVSLKTSQWLLLILNKLQISVFTSNKQLRGCFIIFTENFKFYEILR